MTPECVDHMQLEEGLRAIGERYMRALLTRDNIAFFRIMVGEGRKFPQLLQRHIAAGAEKVRAVVANYLRARAPNIDAEASAPYFLDVLRSRHHYLALADESYALSEAEIETHVRTGVRFFLNGALPNRN